MLGFNGRCGFCISAPVFFRVWLVIAAVCLLRSHLHGRLRPNRIASGEICQTQWFDMRFATGTSKESLTEPPWRFHCLFSNNGSACS